MDAWISFLPDFTGFAQKLPEFFVYGENTMPVSDVDQFKGHGGRAPHGIEIPAGRTETAMASERDKL